MSDKLEALKAAALAIGHERWVQDGSSVNTEDYRIANGEMCCDHIGCFESVNGESPHAKYVAAASPAVVLELLAALEEARKNQRTKWDRCLDAEHTKMQALLSQAERREEHLKADTAVMGKRIAELERRLQQPIKLPDYDTNDYGYKSLSNDEVVAALKEQGFKVEGE